MDFAFTAPLWRRNPGSSWVFITVPAEVSESIRDRPRMPQGAGAVKVRATIGSSSWETSVLWETADAVYLLPVKKPVRTAEGVDEGDAVEVRLELIDR